MSDGWFPEAKIDRGNDAGPYTDTGEPKGLLHTTEGKTYAGARAAYVLNNSWPHATTTFERGIFVIYQHTSIFVAARALKNLAGGVETNRDRIVQLEIVGTADRHNAASWGAQYVENFPRAYLDGIARWMHWVNATLGVPNRCPLTFKAYPESYGTNGVRLSGPAFDAYSGWLGHQHAPENTHGDPGLIDMRYLLAAAGGAPPEEDDMTPEQEQTLNRIAYAVTKFYREGKPGDGRFYVEKLVRPEIDAALVPVTARLAALESAVAQLGGEGGTIDYGKVQDAAEAAVREVFADAAIP